MEKCIHMATVVRLWQGNLVCCALSLSLWIACAQPDSAGAGSTVVKPGSCGEQCGEQVLALQQGLGALGFYDGPVDGLYGVSTVDGVKRFHREYRLPVDGIAGPQTLEALQTALAVSLSGGIVTSAEAIIIHSQEVTWNQVHLGRQHAPQWL